jgi:hypothetical protein
MIKILQSFKRIAVVLCLLFLLSSCGSHKSKESIVKIQVDIIDKTSPDRYCYERGYYINIDMINNSDSTFRFWIMSCSWGDNWVSNTDNLYLFINPCDNNYPIFIQIESGQKKTYKGVLCVKDTLKVIHQSDFMLGLIIVKESEIRRHILSEFSTILDKKIKERKDIIWSEPFKITK